MPVVIERPTGCRGESRKPEARRKCQDIDEFIFPSSFTNPLSHSFVISLTSSSPRVYHPSANRIPPNFHFSNPILSSNRQQFIFTFTNFNSISPSLKTGSRKGEQKEEEEEEEEGEIRGAGSVCREMI